jgi:hypothetical protein
MFNIGGIFRGIGDAAESAVVQGRKNKHEQEQMSLRADLADKAASKARTQLINDKLNQEKLDRKERYNDLLFMGFDDPIALAASRTKGAFESAKQDLALMRKLTESDKKQRNINDAYTVGFKKSVKAPDFVKGTAPTINAQSVLEQIDKATTMEGLSNIDFGDAVIKRNDVFFNVEETHEEIVEGLKTELLEKNTALLQINKLEKPEEHERAENEVARVSLKLIERLDAQKKTNATVSAALGEAPFESGELQGYMESVDKIRKDEFDLLLKTVKEGKVPEGLLSIDFNSRDLENNFVFGDGAVKIKGSAKKVKEMQAVLNYVTSQAVDRQVKIIKGERGDGTHIDYFKGLYTGYFATTDVSNLFAGVPFVNSEDEIPTPDYFNFLKKRVGKKVSLQVGKTGDALTFDVTPEMIAEYEAKLYGGP